jgi:hypothetical protein
MSSFINSCLLLVSRQGKNEVVITIIMVWSLVCYVVCCLSGCVCGREKTIMFYLDFCLIGASTYMHNVQCML